MNKFYITTTLPYVNSDPHIGFALELIQADVIARYHRLLGDEVIFNTGTDEHGVKIYRKALEAGKSPQDYVDEYAERFRRLTKTLHVSTTHFIRTTDSHHKKAAQVFWERCFKNGDIYKDAYKIKYCIGCELEKTDSELEDGRCPVHPNLAIEEREEENYFFRFSKYQKKLLALYKKNPDFVVPSFRLQEIKNFVESGLRDFSISRLASKMPWGVPVPGDPAHVMFVWFDALVDYISTLGWPEDEKNFTDFWPCVQIAGKDNLRQQSAMWQAMLLSAGLPPSKQILIHGFITAKGEKMSKSLGNVIDPFFVVEKYGIDTVRYFLLREIPFGEDGDFSFARLEERYNADLANGIGNLVARVATLAAKISDFRFQISDSPLRKQCAATWKEYETALADYRFHDTLAAVWELITACDEYLEEQKPWKPEARSQKPEAVIAVLLESLRHLAWMLWPIMPTTAERIFEQLGILDTSRKQSLDEAKKWGGMKFVVKKGDALFPRRVKELKE